MVYKNDMRIHYTVLLILLTGKQSFAPDVAAVEILQRERGAGSQGFTNQPPFDRA